MSLQENQDRGQVIYRADDNTVQALRGINHHIHQLGNQYTQRPVRIQTLDGVTYEGRIAHVDGDHLFLVIPGPPMQGHHGGGHHDGQYPGLGQQGQQWQQGQQGMHPQYRSLFGGSFQNDVILPLVLYSLLAITLL